MIRYALNCESGHDVRKLVCELGRLRQAGQAQARGLPALRLDQGREGDHGAAARRAPQAAAHSAGADAGRRAGSSHRPGEAPVADDVAAGTGAAQKLKELRDHLTKNADHVGPRFPEEARKMHYGEIEHRSIYGEASPEEAKELHEEGIEFHPLPILPDEFN